MAGFSSAASATITPSQPVAAMQRAMSAAVSTPPFASTGIETA